MDVKSAPVNPYRVRNLNPQAPEYVPVTTRNYEDFDNAIEATHPDCSLDFKPSEGKVFSPASLTFIPCAQYQLIVVADSRATDAIMNLYNVGFTDLLVRNRGSGYLDTLFSKSVTRFGRKVTSAPRIKRLMPLWSKDNTKCVETTCGPGLCLSSWPPDKPFLHNAARLGCAAIVGRLLDHYGCYINTRQAQDRGTALHVAAYYGHLDVVEVILERNPDTRIKNKHQETPIQAAEAGHRDYNSNKEQFFPMLRSARSTNGNFVPETRLRLGTNQTASTHPAWKSANWKQIVKRLSVYDKRYGT